MELELELEKDAKLFLAFLVKLLELMKVRLYFE